MGAVIRFENVGIRYGLGSEILHDISFAVEEGAFLYLTGVSGAGKTSLLRLLYLAHRPHRGLVYMFGHDTANLRRRQFPEFRRKIGVVFQDFRLLNHLSAFDNIALPLRLRGTSEDRIKKNVTELMEWVELIEKRNAFPLTLSGGQQQRVAIARAIITNPKLLLADEPTGNVDDAIAKKLLYLFEQLNRNGTSVIIATHNQRLLSEHPHDMLMLQQGSVRVMQRQKNGQQQPINSNMRTRQS